MTLPRGYAFEGEGEDVRAVAVVDPVYHDDAETAAPPRDFETYAERLLSVLEGSPKTSAARVAALRRIMEEMPALYGQSLLKSVALSAHSMTPSKRQRQSSFSTPANTLSEGK